MKKLLILYIVLCLIPIVSAELELEEIRVYINNGDDGIIYNFEDKDEIYLNRGDRISIRVELNNNMDNDTRYYLEGDIDYIGDERIPSGSGWKTIDENDPSKTTYLTFDIVPDDMPYDDNYDFDFEIGYKYTNGTEGRWDYEWEVIIEKDRSGTKKIELEDVMRNMSSTCSNVVSQMTQTFDYINRYDNVSRELSTCREERGTYKSQADEKEKTLIQCQTDRDNYKDDEEDCEEKQLLMISKSDCRAEKDDEIEDAVNKAKKDKDNTMIGVIGGGAIIGYVYWKRKKGVSVHDKFYEEKKIP